MEQGKEEDSDQQSTSTCYRLPGLLCGRGLSGSVKDLFRAGLFCSCILSTSIFRCPPGCFHDNGAISLGRPIPMEGERRGTEPPPYLCKKEGSSSLLPMPAPLPRAGLAAVSLELASGLTRGCLERGLLLLKLGPLPPLSCMATAPLPPLLAASEGGGLLRERNLEAPPPPPPPPLSWNGLWGIR